MPPGYIAKALVDFERAILARSQLAGTQIGGISNQPNRSHGQFFPTLAPHRDPYKSESEVRHASAKIAFQ
jgi:hypothetical protein